MENRAKVLDILKRAMHGTGRENHESLPALRESLADEILALVSQPAQEPVGYADPVFVKRFQEGGRDHFRVWRPWASNATPVFLAAPPDAGSGEAMDVRTSLQESVLRMVENSMNPGTTEPVMQFWKVAAALKELYSTLVEGSGEPLYQGPDLTSFHLLAGGFTVRESITPEGLENDEDQGRDVVDLFIGCAFRLGVEQGLRMWAEKLEEYMRFVDIVAPTDAILAEDGESDV